MASQKLGALCGCLNVIGEITRGHLVVDAYSHQLDVLYNFMPAKTLAPYLALGGGGTTTEF